MRKYFIFVRDLIPKEISGEIYDKLIGRSDIYYEDFPEPEEGKDNVMPFGSGANEENIKRTNNKVMRKFDTGATRHSDEGKLDYEGFLSPAAMKRYAEYLHKHRIQADGKIRESDNWQRGIPFAAYMKSKWRHFIESWTWHRKFSVPELDGVSYDDLAEMEESLCAELFNTFGYLHEILKITLTQQE